MSNPTREEVQAFIDALRYGMKVSHAPAFLIALAEGWLSQHPKAHTDLDSFCSHEWFSDGLDTQLQVQFKCAKCGELSSNHV